MEAHRNKQENKMFNVDITGLCVVEWKRNLVAHGEAREEKWRVKRRMEWVVSSPALYRSTVHPALLPLMRTPRLPAVDWTETPADINGLVRFPGRPNLVSARVPSHSVFTLQHLWYWISLMKTYFVKNMCVCVLREEIYLLCRSTAQCAKTNTK